MFETKFLCKLYLETKIYEQFDQSNFMNDDG